MWITSPRTFPWRISRQSGLVNRLIYGDAKFALWIMICVLNFKFQSLCFAIMPFSGIQSGRPDETPEFRGLGFKLEATSSTKLMIQLCLFCLLRFCELASNSMMLYKTFMNPSERVSHTHEVCRWKQSNSLTEKTFHWKVYTWRKTRRMTKSVAFTGELFEMKKNAANTWRTPD